jgi:hypothetical protein
MRNEFGATRALIVVAVLVCAILMVAHLHEQVASSALPFPSFLLWPIELITYALAALVWIGRWTARSVAVAVPGMVASRLIICLGAAQLSQLSGRAGGRSADPWAVANDGICWIVAIIFSMLLWHPLRFLLTTPTPHRRRRPLVARPLSAKAAVGRDVKPDEEALLAPSSFPGNPDELIRVASDHEQPPLSVGLPLEDFSLEGEVNLPAGIILSQLPTDRLTPRAAAMEDRPVTVPLRLLSAGLRQGEISVSFRHLLSPGDPDGLGATLAPALTDPAGWSDDEVRILVPLHLVVSQVPADTWVLPECAPPPWLELSEEEHGEQFAFAER